MILDYLYFRFFKLGKFMAMGLSYPQYRAAFVSSLCLGFNILTILPLLGYCVLKGASLMVVIFFCLMYALWLRFFMNVRRYRRVMKKYGKESFVSSLIGNWLTALYLIVSFIWFIKVQASYC